MITKKIICTPVTFGGSIEKGKPYSNFKEKIKSELKGNIKEDVELKIQLFLFKKRIRKDRNDLDNFLKPIIDSIDKNVIDSETQISFLSIERIKVDSPEKEGIIIEINPVQT